MMPYMFGNHAKVCGNSFVSHVVSAEITDKITKKNNNIQEIFSNRR
jgi:hypothetical protein